MSLGKINRYEFLTGEEILLSDQSKIIELRTKFTYSPLGKEIKQVQALKPSKAEENKEDIKTIERFF